MTPGRVVVCGGRFGANRFLAQVATAALISVERWPRSTVFIDGEASGYDTFVHEFAARWGFPTERYKVDAALDGDGDDAPKRRNTRMRLEGKPDACLAFPGGPGTRNMWQQCFNAGLPVYSVEVAGDKFTIHWMQKGQRSRIAAEGKLR